MSKQSHKEIASDFLILCAKGDSRRAFSLYVGPGFKHHNAYFKGDGETLMLAMEQAAKDQPDKTFDMKQVLHDGNLVAVHSHFKLTPKDPGYAVIHILRFQGDKIVELWDFAQAIPAEQINENGMF